MKKVVLLSFLFAPLALAAPLSNDDGQALMERLKSSASTCNRAKLDDRDGQKACEDAQELEKQLFSGGWCYAEDTRRYAPCDPGLKDFLDDVFSRRKTTHREVVWAYPISPLSLSEIVPLGAFPVRFYPERKCPLPLTNASNMRYMERSAGPTSISGCYWRVLGNRLGTVYMSSGQPIYESFHESTIVVTKMGKNGTHLMVVDKLMTREQIRNSISNN